LYVVGFAIIQEGQGAIIRSSIVLYETFFYLYG